MNDTRPSKAEGQQFVGGDPVDPVADVRALFTLDTPEDLIVLAETVEIECKLAAGKDGKGELPQDFWPTYSAFANTRGGVIVLGVRESDDGFEIAGIGRPAKMRTDLFNALNNKQKVSINLLRDEDVVLRQVGSKYIMLVYVPPASRRSKPVYINSDPVAGTFRRLHDGDRRCDEDAVQRMYAERSDSRDDAILKGFTLSDLDVDTVAAYRATFTSNRPGHVFLEQDDPTFLRSIGAWRRDRESGQEGITAAGLLMFGRYGTIVEAFPTYLPDYQEQPADADETRWIDRLTLDGSWSGNLFDFYRRTYRKLIADIKVPFALRNGLRRDESPVHEALREALVNVLVHADYGGRSSLLIVKRSDGFTFRNPGLMRVPPELGRRGGDGDARNRSLQNMFSLVGASDRAGSGLPKIYRNWEGQHWRPPAYEQRQEPSEQTRLDLSMLDILPPDHVGALEALFGPRFGALDGNERLILAMASSEGSITHSTMRPLCNMHPVDLTRMLQKLVDEGFLTRSGRKSGATYQITDLAAGDMDPELPLAAENDRERTEFVGLSAELAGERTESDPKRTEYERQSAESNPLPAYASVGQTDPMASPAAESSEGIPTVSTLDGLDPELLGELRAIALASQRRGRLSLQASRSVIFKLCHGRYVSLRVLGELLGRNPTHLRVRIINNMVEDGSLFREHAMPNHPRQAYISAGPE